MSDRIKDEIKIFSEKFNLELEKSIVLFYATIIKLYFVEKLGKEYKRKIDNLIKKQIGYDLINYEIKEEVFIKEVKNIFDDGDIDIISSVYDKLMDKNLKKIFGKFYTPLPLVNHIIDSIELDKKPEGKIIDLACGASVFLSASVKRLIKLKTKENREQLFTQLINQVYGLDIDESACALSKLNLLVSTFPLWKELFINKNNFEINFNIFHFNSLNLFKVNSPIQGIKFDFVVGNPPYVEAKKLPKKNKDICKKNFPEVTRGAFDIYICFIHLAMLVLEENGYLGYVLPNKFLVAKYANHIRQRILEEYSIKEICDISNLNYFKDTDVYPILFILKNKKDGKTLNTISSITSKKDFESNNYKFVEFNQERYRLFSDVTPFYTFEDELDKNIFFKIMDNTTCGINTFLEVKTTISFHQKGLREQYISKEVKSNYKFKYLGGESYARKNEVGAFYIEWKGYYINYDNEKLKEIKNPLPPISNFMRPKVIFCQHAKRMLAYADVKSEWVTKDVYPIAFLKDTENEIERTNYYTGLLNSNTFSYIYGLVWKGIQIAEGYFHFLPSFMSIIPIPPEDPKIIKKVANLVKKLQEVNGENDNLVKNLNKIFYELYNLSEKEIKRVEEYSKTYFEK